MRAAARRIAAPHIAGQRVEQCGAGTDKAARLEILEELIRAYQLEHQRNVRFLVRLERELAKLLNLPGANPDNATGSALRASALRAIETLVLERVAVRAVRQYAASLPRAPDRLSGLLDLTYLNLAGNGRRTRPQDVFGALGRNDVQGILRPSPQSAPLYGRAPDPRRTYWDRNLRLIYWHDGQRARETTEHEARKRLKRVLKKYVPSAMLTGHLR